MEQISLDVGNRKDSDILKWLANGPRKTAMSFSGYIINGQRFHIKSIERSTQNSGVSIDASAICRSSDGDGSPKIDVVTYYGVLTEIILLDYYVYRLPMFKCDWAKIHNGVKVDDGFTLVNLHQNQSQFSSEPYILASQAKQVFYARENDNSPWYVVLKAPPRGFHELDKYDENVDTSFMGDRSSLALDDIDDKFEYHNNSRDDCEGILL